MGQWFDPARLTLVARERYLLRERSSWALASGAAGLKHVPRSRARSAATYAALGEEIVHLADHRRPIIAYPDVGGETELVAASQALPVELILALLHAKGLERLDEIGEVDLVEWDCLDAESLRRRTACIDDALRIWPPWHWSKLGSDVELAFLAANWHPSLISRPLCQLLAGAESIGLGSVNEVASLRSDSIVQLEITAAQVPQRSCGKHGARVSRFLAAIGRCRKECNEKCCDSQQQWRQPAPQRPRDPLFCQAPS